MGAELLCGRLPAKKLATHAIVRTEELLAQRKPAVRLSRQAERLRYATFAKFFGVSHRAVMRYVRGVGRE